MGEKCHRFLDQKVLTPELTDEPFYPLMAQGLEFHEIKGKELPDCHDAVKMGIYKIILFRKLEISLLIRVLDYVRASFPQRFHGLTYKTRPKSGPVCHNVRFAGDTPVELNGWFTWSRQDELQSLQEAGGDRGMCRC